MFPGSGGTSRTLNPADVKKKAMYVGVRHVLIRCRVYKRRFDLGCGEVQPLPAAEPDAPPRAVLVAGIDTPRGFSQVDQTWLALIADKIAAALPSELE